MPLLDIATTQPCVRNNVCSVSSQNVFGTRPVFNNEIRFVSTWNSFRIPQKAPNSRIKLFRGGLMIRAVATLEKGPTKNTQGNEEQNDFGSVRMGKYSGSSTCHVTEQQSPSEELNEREKLRRMRISKANKGNTPWNKGRKHSPETLQRIRERTRLAMQDPKVMSCKHDFMNEVVKDENLIKKRGPQKSSRNSTTYSATTSNDFVTLMGM